MKEFTPGFDNDPIFRRLETQPGEGVRMTGVGDSRVISAEPVRAQADAAVAAEASHPFLCGPSASSATPFVTGSINGVPVSGTVNVSTIGTQYVYAVTSHTVDISANGYVAPEFSGTPTYALASGSSVPTDTNSAFHLLVATYVDGNRTAQHVTGPLFVRPRDSGNGSSTAVAYWWGGGSMP